MDDQIASYLGQGFSQADTARIVGCTEGFISQLIKDESFKEKLRAEYAKHQSTRVDARMATLKEKTIRRITEQLEYAEIPDAVRILEAVSRIENAKIASTVPTGNVTQFITVSMGAVVQPQEVVINERREIVAIGNKSLAPMATEGVKKLFESLSKSTESLSKGDSNEPQAISAPSGTRQEPALAVSAAA